MPFVTINFTSPADSVNSLQADSLQSRSAGRNKFDRKHLVGVVLIAASCSAALLLLGINSEISRSFPYFFLFPWILLLFAVLVVPSAILFRQGKFSFANPLVYATWSYFFPAFVMGGITLSIGWSQPYFLNYIQDAPSNLPWTIVLIILGYSGLTTGYFLPVGSAAGRVIGNYFTISSSTPVSYFNLPGILLVLLGMVNSAIALALGVIGYQASREITPYDGLIFLSTLFWLEGGFILWYVVFKSSKVTVKLSLVIGFLVTTSLLKALFSGNRGNLLQSLIVIMLAFVLSGRALRVKQAMIGGFLFAFLLMAGMVYGTTFRNVRGNETGGGIATYTDNIFETLTRVMDLSSEDAVEFGLTSLAERIDTVSSLAVVVSNYEELAPYEESYGLNDNIRKDFITSFVPRILWNDKPVASDSRSYGELYFDLGGNAFAMTPIGDLLRNFGIPGVFGGMLLLGILLRSMFRALIEDREVNTARATLYFMLLVSISYEGFYGLILPYFFKIGIAALLGVLIVTFLAARLHRSASTALAEARG